MALLISNALSEYVEEHSDKTSPLLQELEKVTYDKTENPGMISGQINGKFFKLLCNLLQAKNVLEIGTFTGYSALCMAEGMPDDGRIITCDNDPVNTQIAQSFWNQSEYGKKIELRLGNAVETIKSLDGPFDFVFIDADKKSYPTYWKLVLPKVRKGGIIAIDNVFQSGGVLDPTRDVHQVIDDFNKMVKNDPNVDVIMLTVRDGITLAQKL